MDVVLSGTILGSIIGTPPFQSRGIEPSHNWVALRQCTHKEVELLLNLIYKFNKSVTEVLGGGGRERPVKQRVAGGGEGEVCYS